VIFVRKRIKRLFEIGEIVDAPRLDRIDGGPCAAFYFL
jgi:hypothetical protein